LADARCGPLRDRRAQLLDGPPTRRPHDHRRRRRAAPATRAWNLNYRIAAAQQGQGYATELARAAYAAASDLDAAVPFIAWVAEHNVPSRRVAERLGLTNYGVAVDPSDDQPRLAYADRSIIGFTGG
jgi:RimJ/RimL family protein N-acetyltransferase